jgi:hypothetical protein
MVVHACHPSYKGGSQSQRKSKKLSKNTQRRLEAWLKLLECLPSKHEFLSSSSSKKEKKWSNEGQGEERFESETQGRRSRGQGHVEPRQRVAGYNCKPPERTECECRLPSSELGEIPCLFLKHPVVGLCSIFPPSPSKLIHTSINLILISFWWY